MSRRSRREEVASILAREIYFAGGYKGMRYD